MRRLRETLFKLIIIVGVCKPLDAIFRIEAITRPEDKDYSFSRYAVWIESASITANEAREGWQCDEANRKRGMDWLDRIYQHNMQSNDEVFASQRDFGEYAAHHFTHI
jgi:hypothetical protein